MSDKAFNIERRSFEIIDAEVGSHDYTDDQWIVVRRVVHATADFDFATGKDKIMFKPQSIISALDAIGKGCAVVTDVDMVLSGLNKRSISELGLKPLCSISDPAIAERAMRTGGTRSELAMRSAAKEMNGGIVAIGNAPTALYEVIRMIRERETNPALVIGIPVGFVAAAESKAELSRVDIPSITNSGRKGGSPVASSIVNALMLLYQSKNLSS